VTYGSTRCIHGRHYDCPPLGCGGDGRFRQQKAGRDAQVCDPVHGRDRRPANESGVCRLAHAGSVRYRKPEHSGRHFSGSGERPDVDAEQDQTDCHLQPIHHGRFAIRWRGGKRADRHLHRGG